MITRRNAGAVRQWNIAHPLQRGLDAHSMTSPREVTGFTVDESNDESQESQQQVATYQKHSPPITTTIRPTMTVLSRATPNCRIMRRSTPDKRRSDMPIAWAISIVRIVPAGVAARTVRRKNYSGTRLETAVRRDE